MTSLLQMRLESCMYCTMTLEPHQNLQCSVVTFALQTVFSKCEEELSQRLERIFELLEIPVSKKTTSPFDSQQVFNIIGQ